MKQDHYIPPLILKERSSFSSTATRLHILYLPAAAVCFPITLNRPRETWKRVQTSRGSGSETQEPLCSGEKGKTSRLSGEGCKNKNVPVLRGFVLRGKKRWTWASVRVAYGWQRLASWRRPVGQRRWQSQRARWDVPPGAEEFWLCRSHWTVHWRCSYSLLTSVEPNISNYWGESKHTFGAAPPTRKTGTSEFTRAPSDF